MTQTIPIPDPGRDADAPFLDCERLDCFRVAVEFQTLAARLAGLRGLGALRDQLDRASVSIVLNIAEGAGRNSPRELIQFLGIASGSKAELETHLEIARRLGMIGDDSAVFRQIERVGQLLTALRKSLQAQANPR